MWFSLLAPILFTTPKEIDILSNPILPKLVLLDRDGVINHDVGSPGVLQPSKLDLTPNAARAIGDLRRASCKVALVTNQSCVGKGIIKHSELKYIHETLQSMLIAEDSDAILDKLYVCTSTNDQDDQRMKPNPGMILEALEQFGVNGNECVFVGDTATDMLAALKGGVSKRVLVSTGYGKDLMIGSPFHAKYFSSQMDKSSPLSVTKFHPYKCKSAEDAPKLPQSVLPFFLVKDLSCAVELILCGI
mmetsp:Transcript_29281/g.33703  ORF Transcript_29281/g.33703 Transcript_29281/m.33703 type:complete len:246 (+) Transcript_29281:33-770(+)